MRVHVHESYSVIVYHVHVHCNIIIPKNNKPWAYKIICLMSLSGGLLLFSVVGGRGLFLEFYHGKWLNTAVLERKRRVTFLIRKLITSTASFLKALLVPEGHMLHHRTHCWIWCTVACYHLQDFWAENKAFFLPDAESERKQGQSIGFTQISQFHRHKTSDTWE